MMYYEEIEAKLKELNRELRNWRRTSSNNPWGYVDEYTNVMTRRIAAYETLLLKAPHVIYGPLRSRGTSLWDR